MTISNLELTLVLIAALFTGMSFGYGFCLIYLDVKGLLKDE